MPPKKKARVAAAAASATESPLLPFLEQTPLKGNKAALEVFGMSMSELCTKLESVILSDILQEEDAPLLKGNISHVFKQLKDEDISSDLRKQWYKALACQKFLQPEQLTLDMIRDHLLASAFEVIVCERDKTDVERLASLLGATPVPSAGGDVDPIIEGILDALVPPDEFLLRTRERLLEEAGLPVPPVQPRVYGKEGKGEEKEKESAASRGGAKRGAKGKTQAAADGDEEESDSEEPAAAAETKKGGVAASASKRKRKRGEDKDDDEGEKDAAEEERTDKDEEGSESEKEEANPMMTEDQDALTRRTVGELRNFLEEVLKVEIKQKKPVKKDLISLVLEKRSA